MESVVLSKRYAGQWPTDIFFRTYSDALEVLVANPSLRGRAAADLATWFGPCYDEERSVVLLESTPDHPRTLPVVFEEQSGLVDSPASPSPSFARLPLFPAGDAHPRLGIPDPFPSGSSPVLAFYSFKGGVGRTTHLVALVKAISERQSPRRPFLIVDADLEAPGLTWWARPLLGRPEVSFLDLLALAQYDDSPEQVTTLNLVSQRLRQQPLFLETSAGRFEHYFLPAFREIQQGMRMPLRPEHLVRVPGQEWLLGVLLARLGQAVGAQAVIVDLRAGFSEIASPLLFDPRIRRVLVTSTSSQSVDGTCAVLSEMRKLSPPVDADDLFEPTAVISLVPQGQDHLAAQVRQKLFEAYPNVEEADVLSARLRVEETAFAQQLVHLDGFQAAWEQLGGTDMARTMAELAREWFPEPATMEPAQAGFADGTRRQDLRRRLADTAQQLEMAESGKGEDFLRTSALEKLGHRFQYELPLAIVMGAKGSGKTYMYLQMLRRATWSQFLLALGLPEAPQTGPILPLLAPLHLHPPAKEFVDQFRRSTLRQLGSPTDFQQTTLVDRIRAFLSQEHADETLWRRFWLHRIGDALGLDLDRDAPEASLQQALEQRNAQVVVVVDGLEDLFQDLPRQSGQQVALRALCQDLPAALREIPGRRVGLVVFVRKDLVKSAVLQNFGQFESLHSPYELRWNPEEALRLAVWLCRLAGVDVWPERPLPLEAAPRDALEEALYPVWGYKMGGPESREAVTARWVLAALSDFRGRLQARDVVRFFRHAAQRAQQLQDADRLLQPAAVRGAIVPCSEEKVAEVQQEIPWLGEIFNRFRKAPDRRRIPFQAADFELKPEDVRLLSEVGIVLEQEGALYMPEIFRLGLGFRLESGARPRVLTLMKRALGTL